MPEFVDRVDAGQRLAGALGHVGDDVVVLGLPRGGVPVAAEVARGLRAPLDVIVVRKLGVPAQPELAMGAVGEGGARFVDRRIVERAGVGPTQLARAETRERGVIEVRVRELRRGRPRQRIEGRTAVVVDDGIATGATARVACAVARRLGARRVVLAVPVGPPGVADAVPEADEVVCLRTPARFRAVGQHYADFRPVTDEEVIELLSAAAPEHRNHDSGIPWPPVPADPSATAGGPGNVPGGARHGVELEAEVPAGEVVLAGTLALPVPGAGVVLFAHGSGSSRFSPRNRRVAAALGEAGLGTLLLDLLTPSEEQDRANVFDIPLLADRLLAATRWLAARPDTGPVGYFGASTGAGAALYAAAEPGNDVAAVVSRGGRPDLAGERLGQVRAPTLLLVGGADSQVLALNRRARSRLRCPSDLVVVPGATHLFEEPGALEHVSRLARDWFLRHLVPGGAGRDRGPETSRAG